MKDMTGIEGKGVEKKGRLEREKRTIRLMLDIFCAAHHARRDGLCAGCRSLEEYALERIDRCPYKGRKPACNACPIHCYRRCEREEIRRVMRFAGPRMLFSHPVLALLHLLDGVRGRRGNRG